MLRRWLVLLALVLMGSGISAPPPTPKEEKAARTVAQQKLDSHLVQAIQNSRNPETTEPAPDLEITDGRVLVDIDALVSPELLAEISTLDGEVVSSFPRYAAIRALVPLAALETLAGRPHVRFIAPAAQATTNPDR